MRHFISSCKLACVYLSELKIVIPRVSTVTVCYLKAVCIVTNSEKLFFPGLLNNVQEKCHTVEHISAKVFEH